MYNTVTTIMSSLVSQKRPATSFEQSKDLKNHSVSDQSVHHQEEDGAGAGQNDSSFRVTSQLYLKPSQAAGTLDREVVLRRIRHRKRVNNVKKAFQSLLSYPFSSKIPDNQGPVPQTVRWTDDPFAAP